MTELTLQPCPPEFCSHHRERINQACRDLEFPPGHPILMALPDGGYCYCTCGGRGDARPEARTVEE